jgi:hypothetical protein
MAAAIAGISAIVVTTGREVNLKGMMSRTKRHNETNKSTYKSEAGSARILCQPGNRTKKPNTDTSNK